MITIYHARRARSARVVWLLEELGLPYEARPLEFTPAVLQGMEYKRMHPLGQVPVIQDGALTMFESGAILEYILERYAPGKLQPAVGSPERGPYLQWFHYGEATVARHLSDIVRHRFILPEGERIPAYVEQARVRFRQALEVVDTALEGKQYMLGDTFSAADIMVSYGIVMARIVKELPPELTQVAAYLERLKARPAYQKAWA